MTILLRHILVSDLAGAILGHADALEGLRLWLAHEREHMGVVYFTRHPVLFPRQLLERFKLPTPDFLISAQGAEIYDFALEERISSWSGQQDAGWNAEEARRVALLRSDVHLQPEEYQTSRAVSLEISTLTPRRVRELELALARDAVVAQIAVSGDYVTLLPRGSHPCTAIDFIAQRLRIPTEHVIVSVGDECDATVFQRGFAGTATANSGVALPAALAGKVYRSPFSYADGVIDGVQYWRERWQHSNDANAGRAHPPER